jgi:ligand-binding sensor domain-containing protein
VRIYHWLKEQEMYWQWLPQMLPQISRATWIVLGLFVAFLAVVYLSALLAVSLGSIGWSHLSAGSTLLPSNTVYDILPLPDGRVILGTERGAALWSPPPASDLPDRWVVFNHQNSGLPSSRVLALARDDAGTLWFGTEAGLSRYDEAAAAWQTYRAADLGLSGDQVRALAFANDGRLWVGTQTGAATWDGRAWTTYTTANSGLADDHVFALVVAPEGSVTWFGTLRGVSRLDTQTGAWRTFTTADSDLGAAGVSDLLIDSTGRVWAATTGGGLSVWDGATWRTYRAGTDSLPFSTVNALFEAPAGTIWAASSASMDVGGALASFDGKMWRTYLPRNSGFSGAEPLSFALDDRGRLWIGTRTKGVDIYQLSK